MKRRRASEGTRNRLKVSSSLPSRGSFRIQGLCMSPDGSLREALRRLDQTAKGIVLVVDTQGRLLGTITDGDIRRAILAGVSIESRVSLLLKAKKKSPVTAFLGAQHGALLKLMLERRVRQIPLLDSNGRIAHLVTMDDLMPGESPAAQAMIMAGGRGARLYPLTKKTPKPMLHVGDRPLLERLMAQLREAGIRRVHVATHYKKEKIHSHFRDGRRFGVDIRYVSEKKPLGTAGAVGLMVSPKEPILVINGDVLTSVNFRELLAFHREHGAEITVAVRQYDLNVPFGVVHTKDVLVTHLVEKPVLKFFVNAGIYVLEPSVQRHIPKGRRFDMTDLIQKMIKKKARIVSFPVIEYWLDVGQPAQYDQAQIDVKKLKHV